MALEARVDEALADGSRSLVDVAGRVLPVLPSPEQYRAAGLVAELVAARARVSAPLERSWIAVGDVGLALEDWALQRRGEP
jgi:hypothetical protein